jgi:hypothetical protein
MHVRRRRWTWTRGVDGETRSGRCGEKDDEEVQYGGVEEREEVDEEEWMRRTW